MGGNLAFFEVFKWIPIVPMVRAKRRVRRLPLRLRPPGWPRVVVDTVLCNP